MIVVLLTNRDLKRSKNEWLNYIYKIASLREMNIKIDEFQGKGHFLKPVHFMISDLRYRYKEYCGKVLE